MMLYLFANKDMHMGTLICYLFRYPSNCMTIGEMNPKYPHRPLGILKRDVKRGEMICYDPDIKQDTLDVSVLKGWVVGVDSSLPEGRSILWMAYPYWKMKQDWLRMGLEEFNKLFLGQFDTRPYELARKIWEEYEADARRAETSTERTIRYPTIAERAYSSYSEAQALGFAGDLSEWKRVIKTGWRTHEQPAKERDQTS